MEKDFIIRQTDEELQQLLDKVYTPDTAPRENSDKLITSGAVFGALEGKQEMIENLPEILKSVGKKTDEVLPVTWQDLKELRDNGDLRPGQWYRITDYMTTTSQLDTRSAGHQFDILVMADDNGVLSETALAIQHTTEENDYFHYARLEGWKLKYCLDNDTARFAWADPTNGKGVIYEMEDEWGNSCPYDFKNIMFKRSYCEPDAFDGEGKYFAIPGLKTGKDNELLPGQDDNDFIYMYTFSCLASLDEDPSAKPAQADASMGVYQTEDVMSADYGDSPRPLNNIIDAYFVCQSIDDEPMTRVRALPNITFGQFYTASASYNVRNNHFGGDCHELSLKGKQFYNNTLKAAHDSYFFGDVRNSSFGYVEYSSFGYVDNSSFGDVRYSQFFGYVRSSSFGDVYNSSFGNVRNSSFGNVEHSSFGYVEYSSFGDVRNCQFFGNVYSSSFGYVDNSSFGNIEKSKGSASISNADFKPATTGGTIGNIEVVGAMSFGTKTTVTVPAGGSTVQYIGLNSSGTVKIWKPADLVQ